MHSIRINGLFCNSIENKNLLVILLIAIFSVLAYLPLWSNGMVTFDNTEYVIENENIKSFSIENIWWMLTSFYAANWHPLTWFSLAIDYAIYELNPTGYLATNLLLHVVNSLLLYHIAIKIFRALGIGNLRFAAFLSALLFAIHPQHVEVVAWIAERKELLCTFFTLLCIAAYLKFLEGDIKAERWWYYVSVIWAGLALSSKPMAVTIPLVLLILDVYPLGRTYMYDIVQGKNQKQNINLLIKEKIPFIAMSALVCVFTILAQNAGGAIASVEKLDIKYRILNASHSFFLYLTKWLLPINLSPFYQYEDYPATGISFIQIVPIFAVVGIFFISVVLWRKNRKHWLMAFLYYSITVLPVIGLVQVGVQAAADRYTYVPLIPFYLMAGVGLASLFRSNRGEVARAMGGTLAFLIVSSLVFFTYQQTKIWKNDFVLWYYASLQSPNSALVRHNYGLALYRLGRYDEAINEFNIALELGKSALTFQMAGYAYYEKGEYEKAKRRLIASLKERQHSSLLNRVEVLNRLAKIYIDENNKKDARKCINFALAVDANNLDSLKIRQQIEDMN